MSYRSDMEAFAREAQKRKKLVGWVLKITILVLAATVLVAAVGIGITLAQGGFGGDDESGDDTKKPVIRGPEGNTQIVYTGDNISYKSFVQVNDDGGQCDLSVEIFDSDNKRIDAIDSGKLGTYTVKYTATDAAGNKSTYVLTVIVKNGEYSEQKLMTLVEAKAKELGITKDMSKETQVRKIYAFVHSWVQWGSDESQVSKIYTALYPEAEKFSRSTWKEDWVAEAILSFTKRDGDCYSYYSLSKAFFEYFEIENLGIMRSEDSKEKGTHFWNVVNIGTKENPQWYYYDATELAGEFSDGKDNGCLMTEKKLNSYITSDGRADNEFYKFEKWNGFPTISDKELN